LNWLAHILLSRDDIEYQLGNILADPLKGKAWADASPSLINGMLMHKSIDKFTDSHELFSLSKSRLGSKGYLKGVVIDLLYDHFLANDWSQFAVNSLDDFIDTFNDQAITVSKHYPHQPRQFIQRLVHSDRLRAYADFDGFVSAFNRVQERLSPRLREKEADRNYIQLVEDEYESLKSDFFLFFPQLVSYFKSHDLGSDDGHFLAALDGTSDKQ
jgi:acyl carrier protein phosphodiesterase